MVLKERIIRVIIVAAGTLLLIQTGKSAVPATALAKNPAAEVSVTTLDTEVPVTTLDTEVSAATLDTEIPAATLDTEVSAEIPDTAGQSIPEDTSAFDEYANLAIAQVTNYVNVRKEPNTDSEIVGKIYNGAVAEVLEKAGPGDEWFHITSGSVQGYIKAEFFLYGDAAADVADEYVNRSIVVKADRLNVRKEPDVGASRIGYLDCGEKAHFLEDCGDWIRIQYGANKEGYVASEFVTIVEEFTYAKSIEEEWAEQEALRMQREREKTSESTMPENTTMIAPANTDYSTNEELRARIIEYSMQFLGNKYVSGGNSLVTGTDCSGFTSLIYAEFGYSIGRTPSSQLSSAGRGIDYSEIQPGDIICYGKSKCTHVALYIGNGQIIHSANSRKGVVIYQADYDTILGVRNVID